MSTEKLSEPSKPVAWTSARSLDVRRKITAFTDVESAAEYASANCWEKIVPLYSQEYVSAILAELEAKDKRIAELEERLKLVREQRDNELRTNAELEKRLATPVRLPDTRQSVSGDRYQWSDGVFNYKQDAIAVLRAAGFSVSEE